MRFLLLVTLFLTACGSLPKDQKEFREYSQQHKGAHTVTTSAAFGDVVSRVKAHVAKCISFKTSFTRKDSQTTMHISDQTFGKWENVGPKSATLLIVKDSKQIVNQPEGGQIFFVMDLAGKGSKTVATLYDLNGPSWAVYNYINEFTAVVKGEQSTCQFAEIQG